MNSCCAPRGSKSPRSRMTPPGFLAAVETHRPDVTIVDVRLPPAFRDEGIRAALRARRDRPGLPVLVLSRYVEQEYAGRLLSDTRGGIGYLLKDRVSRVAEFIDALRRVAAGGTAMDPEVIAQLLAVRGDPVGTPHTPRTGGPGPDGRRARQRHPRPAAFHHRQRRPQTHRQHLPQTRPVGRRQRPPPGPGRPGPPPQ
uniref:LuxR family regulator n=1 Tax=Streptomyces lavendulae subsp. lavendulae TaxID=58340 RepID=G9MBW1_STRLA|nr:LuxR family regulator [Streptomyces lavendulae subsp. lavendulae]BAL15762.1 LuxR family regulator [Streptomyces lavendulae subsp. lavendulae]